MYLELSQPGIGLRSSLTVLTMQDKSIEQTASGIGTLGLLLPSGLRACHSLRKLHNMVSRRLRVTIYDDIADGGHFASLDLEVSHIEALFWIGFLELWLLVLSPCGQRLEHLFRRNCALDPTVREVSSSLHDSDATNAFWSSPLRLLSRDEEGQLQLVLGM